MRSIEEVADSLSARYDAYNDISKLLTDNGWEFLREWDTSVTVGGSFTKDWQKISVDTIWEDDLIRLVVNRESVFKIDWDHQWEAKVQTIVDAIS